MNHHEPQKKGTKRPQNQTDSNMATDSKEGVFEIRDFTNASTFERLSHQISLAARHWAQALSSERSEPGKPLELGRTEEVLQMKHGFELGGFRPG
jgi:hypothetical protein